MTFSDNVRAVTIAERACAAVVEHPTDENEWKILFQALEPFVDPTFTEGHENLPAHLRGLFRQACSLGEIVRDRIEIGRNEPVRQPYSATSIQNGVRDLQRVLDELNQFLMGTEKRWRP